MDVTGMSHLPGSDLVPNVGDQFGFAPFFVSGVVKVGVEDAEELFVPGSRRLDEPPPVGLGHGGG